MTADNDDGKVVVLPVVTKLDLPTERVLAGAGEADLNFVVVVGEAADGSLYFASSRASGPEVLWVLEQAKLALLKSGGAWPE